MVMFSKKYSISPFRFALTRSALMLLLCLGVGMRFDLNSSVMIVAFPVVAEICLEVCLGTGNE